MSSKAASKGQNIKVTISRKEKGLDSMNAIRKINTVVGAYQNDWIRKPETKINIPAEAVPIQANKMTRDELNEKLYYFYNNGGPLMDI